MAISATINKVLLNVADMDRHYYHSHELTLAQHPSETDLRFMIRVIAFALNASDQLQFTKGLCVDDEPELWVKSLSDEIELWIDFGQVDEKRIRKACGRSNQVIIYTYNQKKSQVWWQQQSKNLARYKNLKVIHLDAENPESLLQRKVELQCNIQDEEMTLMATENESVITWNILQ